MEERRGVRQGLRLGLPAAMIASKGSTCTGLRMRSLDLSLQPVELAKGSSWRGRGRSLGRFVDAGWERAVGSRVCGFAKECAFPPLELGRLDLPDDDSNGVSERR